VIQVAEPKRSKRRALDFYPAPEWATEALLERVPIVGTVFEPCSGAGDMVRPLERAGVKVVTNDIDQARKTDTHFDARSLSAWPQPGVDWTVTNPPFSDALAIVQNAIAGSRVGVAVLLRLSFLEPTEARQDLLRANPPTRLIVLPRISFTGDGKTDSVTCAWLVWATDHPHDCGGIGIEIVPKIGQSTRANTYDKWLAHTTQQARAEIEGRE
jgi:hypothetical protein